MQTIISKENDLIKQIIKLKEKKYRDNYCKYLVEGVKLIEEALNENVKITHIIVNEEIMENTLIKKCISKQIDTIKYIKVPNNIFKLITDVETPQGILAVAEKPTNSQIDCSQDIILALNDIQDPGNLGTIIRTADSVGLKQILISKGTVDPYNSKVVRSSMGAIFRIEVITTDNLLETIKQIKQKKYNVVVTSLQTNKSIYDIILKNKIVVIGNEAKGVSKEITNLADEKVIIPMLGKTESLNASVATGVILYEYVRQKIKK